MIMKYYIVALFDKDSYTKLSPVQRKYSKKFRGNRNSPLPYLTLNVVETSTIDKIVPIIEKVLQPYKKFKIEYDNNNASIYDPLKSIAVNGEENNLAKNDVLLSFNNTSFGTLTVSSSEANVCVLFVVSAKTFNGNPQTTIIAAKNIATTFFEIFFRILTPPNIIFYKINNYLYFNITIFLQHQVFIFSKFTIFSYFLQ